jgi:hypothetical protein
MDNRQRFHGDIYPLQVAQHSEVNMMTPNNIGVCIGLTVANPYTLEFIINRKEEVLFGALRNVCMSPNNLTGMQGDALRSCQAGSLAVLTYVTFGNQIKVDKLERAMAGLDISSTSASLQVNQLDHKPSLHTLNACSIGAEALESMYVASHFMLTFL